MALRPVLITGVALASAGAIVAATPGLMTPPDIAITAGEARAAESPKSVTVSQLNLLALSDIDLNYLSDVYFGTDGYGGHVGSSYDQYYGGQSALYVQQGVDAAGKPVYVRAVDKDGNPLVSTGAPADGTKVFVEKKNAAGETVYEEVTLGVDADGKPNYDLGYISGDIYSSGLSGVAYYLSDQILDEAINANLPLISDAAAFVYNNVTSYYFEAGFLPTLRVVTSELTGGINAPVGQALAVAEDLANNWNAYAGLALTLAAAGVPLAGPDLAAATNIYFFGGQDVGLGFQFEKEYAAGISGVLNYVADRVMGAPSPLPETAPEGPEDTNAEPDAASAKSGTTVLASARKALPTLEKLINLDLKAEDAAQTSNLLKAVNPSSEQGDTETTIPATEVSQSEEAQTPKAPKFELPKLPKLNLPEIKAPQSNIETTKVETAAGTDTSETETEASTPEAPKSETGTAATSKPEKRGSLVRTGLVATPGAGAKTEQKKLAGEKFVEKAAKDLTNAFKPKTKAGAQEHGKAKGEATSGSGNSGSGNGDSGSGSGDSGSGGSDK